MSLGSVWALRVSLLAAAEDPAVRRASLLWNHRELLLNWFRVKRAISSDVVEGSNANGKLALRKARGFKSYEVLSTALYHQMGRLPEPADVHKFR